MSRIGSGKTWAFFGGSFDPPHVGHVLAAAYALATVADRVVVAPSFAHPFAKRSAPYPHRLRMIELAMADLRNVEVSDVEARLGGASYTVRTVEHLMAQSPGVAWRLVIGSDLVAELPRWHEHERLLSLAPPFVIARAGFEVQGATPIALPALSSTEIRERLARGQSVEGLVPSAVAAHCARHALYR